MAPTQEDSQNIDAGVLNQDIKMDLKNDIIEASGEDEKMVPKQRFAESHPCNLCSRSFARYINLVSHQLNHNKPKVRKIK